MAEGFVGCNCCEASGWIGCGLCAVRDGWFELRLEHGKFIKAIEGHAGFLDLEVCQRYCYCGLGHQAGQLDDGDEGADGEYAVHDPEGCPADDAEEEEGGDDLEEEAKADAGLAKSQH